MGAWGYDIMQNDSACDWAYYVRRMICKAIGVGRKKPVPSTMFANARAAAAMMIATHELINFDAADVRAAIDTMLVMSHDETWIASWRSPMTVQKLIDKEIKDLENLAASIEAANERVARGKARKRKRAKPTA